MIRSAMSIFAILLVLGSCGLSTTAFARGSGHAGGSVDHLRRNHVGGGFRSTPHDAHGGYGDRAIGLGGGVNGYGGRDVWGHWGTYYGPMVHTI
jgi:hypothetical protein